MPDVKWRYGQSTISFCLIGSQHDPGWVALMPTMLHSCRLCAYRVGSMRQVRGGRGTLVMHRQAGKRVYSTVQYSTVEYVGVLYFWQAALRRDQRSSSQQKARTHTHVTLPALAGQNFARQISLRRNQTYGRCTTRTLCTRKLRRKACMQQSASVCVYTPVFMLHAIARRVTGVARTTARSARIYALGST